MLRGCLGLFVLAGCRSLLGFDDVRAVDADAPVDIAIDAEACLGSGFVTVCVPDAVVAVTLDGFIDTTTDTRCLPDQLAFCAIAGSEIGVDNLVAIGARPLVLVASDAIAIAGTLDVSSDRQRAGAGATSEDCGAGTPPVAASGGAGSGGGQGGTFGDFGGNGGTSELAGTGGLAAAPVQITKLRGGCAGTNGASFSAASPGGPGGAPGGAVYLLAKNSIQVTGSINASGGGGSGATGNDQGGGGGGSGGMIGLESSTITIGVTAQIWANGGGGGEGSPGGGPGENGAESAAPGSPGVGAKSTAGGNGGDGGYDTIDAADGESQADHGGGGGGGSIGIILMFGGR